MLQVVALGLAIPLPEARANAPENFYTQIGTDPTFQSLVDSGVIVPGERFSLNPVLGSTIDVDNALLEAQTGPAGPIPSAIRIHTQTNGSVQRSNFHRFTRWYQEDGNVQVMRLFQGEQNVRDGIGPDGTPGRIESFFPAFTVAPGTWSVWEGTYTIIKPLSSNIFQLFHEGGQLWAFHIRMTSSGNITFTRRREIAGLPKTLTIASSAVGKSVSIRVRANGTNYEVFRKIHGQDADWVPMTTGHYTAAVNNQISYRWGMYYGSQSGQSIPNDGLLFVSGVKRTTENEDTPPPPPPPPPSTTYYWDNNGAAAGFGNAAGVWEDTTAGSATQGWSTNPEGEALPEEVSVSPFDPVFFGTDSVALGSGTVTVSETVGVGDLTFGAASGNITLTGGEIAMSGDRLITVGGTGKTHTIRSVLSGTGSRRIGGGSILVLTGENTFSGPLFIGNNFDSALRVRFNSIGDSDGTPSALGAPTTAAEGVIQIGEGTRTSTLEFSGATAPQSTNRQIRVGSDGSGGGNATISNNAAHPIAFTNASFNVAATNTGSSNRILQLIGGNAGDNLIQGAIVNNLSSGTGGMISLTKNGTGTWVLTGANAYTGNTTISNGTLRIGNGGTTGSLSTSSNLIVNGNGILEFRRSNTVTQGVQFSGAAISGTGSILQSGTGTTVLNAANSYEGSTTILLGAVRAAHPQALGSGTAPVTVNGSTTSGGPRLELAGDITVSGRDVAISGGGNFRGALSSQSGDNEWTGKVTVTAPETRIGTSDTGTLRVSGVIDSGGEPHGLIVRAGPVDTSAVVLSGANTYLGDTTLQIGRLVLDGGDNRLPTGSRLVTGNAGDRVELDLNGRHQQIAGLSFRTGVSAPNNNVITNSSATPATLTVLTAAGDPSTWGGILSGNLGLAKVGPDTLTLGRASGSAAHTYSGPTVVHEGTLGLRGVSMVSPITLAPGAALEFTLGAPASSTSTVSLGSGTVKISGEIDGVSDYLLMTASGGFAGTPTLDDPIPGYALALEEGNTRLVLSAVVVEPSYLDWSGGLPPNVDSSGDGLPNAIAWALGASAPLADLAGRLPVLDAASDPTFVLFTFPRGKAAAAHADTTISVEYSTDLTNWTIAVDDDENVIVEVTPGAPGTPSDRVTVKLKRSSLAPAGALFVRLRVSVEAL